MKRIIKGCRVVLAAGEVTELEDAEHYEITSLGGDLWVTMLGDPRDLVISNGQTLLLDRAGTATISTLGGPATVAAKLLDRLAAAA